MNDWIKLSELLSHIKVSKATVSKLKNQWTEGAHFLVVSRTQHLYNLPLIIHWFTHAETDPKLHNQAIYNALSRFDYLHQKGG